MGRLVVLLGATGAGKSIQAERLVRDYGWVHLSSGELLRHDHELAQLLATGRLAPADVVDRLVGNAIASVDAATPIVLDGFPREMDEAKWLDGHLAKFDRELTHVVLVNVDLATSQTRLAARGRADDSREALAEKWHEFRTRTQPVVQHYTEAGLLSQIDGNGTIDEMYEELTRILGV